MGEVYKVETMDELLDYMNKGYNFSIDQILMFFNIRKTQYYEYISNGVNRVKVPKKVRGELQPRQIEDDYLQFFINYMIIMDHSVLLNFDEVFSYMIIKGYFKIDLFNKNVEGYDDVTAEYILNSSDEDIGKTLELIQRALMKSKKWQEFDDDFINNGKAPGNEKTRQSRFYSRIGQYNHFRFRILGVYTYAIIEDIENDLPEALMIKRDGYDFIEKFRST